MNASVARYLTTNLFCLVSFFSSSSQLCAEYGVDLEVVNHEVSTDAARRLRSRSMASITSDAFSVDGYDDMYGDDDASVSGEHDDEGGANRRANRHSAAEAGLMDLVLDSGAGDADGAGGRPGLPSLEGGVAGFVTALVRRAWSHDATQRPSMADIQAFWKENKARAVEFAQHHVAEV